MADDYTPVAPEGTQQTQFTQVSGAQPQQPQYAQPQPQYAQPQQQYAQPQYAHPQYGQQPYVQPQPQYGQPQYGQPQVPQSQPYVQTGYQYAPQPVYVAPGQKVVTESKNLFVWVFCFLLGGFGVDRFVRGQVGLGVCKLLFGWLTIGIWAMVDWIIAMVEAYGSSHFADDEKFVFIDGKYAK